jgi:ribosomal 50S subunit-recycling heat shock protein
MFSQDNVSNLLTNTLARWDSLLFYTQLIRNRKVCQKVIKRKGLILNGHLVKDIFDLQRVAKVGYIIQIKYSRLYFRRF